MPDKCGQCPCFHHEYPMYCQATKESNNKIPDAPYGMPRPDWCPLVEVPTPHGRLIDADELKKEYPHDVDWEYPVNTNGYVSESIDNAQTVVEAEGEDT